MKVKTYKAEDARAKMRDILDDVTTGTTEVVIERHGKPTAVVVGYHQWQAWKRQRKAHHDRIRAEMDARTWTHPAFHLFDHLEAFFTAYPTG